MLAELTAEQWGEWQAFIQIHGPVGEERADIRAALIASTVANVFRGKRDKVITLKDCLLEWDKPTRKGKRQTPEQMHAMAKAMAFAFGAEFKGGQNGDHR